MGAIIKVLFDINVVLPVLLGQPRNSDREYTDAAKAIWEANKMGGIEGYLAGFSLPMIFTHCEGHYNRVSAQPHWTQRKQEARIKAYRDVRLCLDVFVLCELRTNDIRIANQMSAQNPLCNDFEDNLQIAVAIPKGVDVIVTDNLPDFYCAKLYNITALTPSQLLKRI